MNAPPLALLVTITIVACIPFPAPAQSVQSPEQFLGHVVGADYKLAPWEQIVAYFEHLDESSSRIRVRELGKTTQGLSMIMAEISAADTVANLDVHRANQRKLADPRLIKNQAEEQRLANESKVAILVNAQLHSSETAGSQMTMELAYNLVTGESPAIREILDRCIILIIPCANPDGQKMVAEWYDKSIGTPWEGVSGMPWIYQKYAGHDNNRDWFMLNLKETRLTTKVLYDEWFPTIVWDVHQMGSTGARLFVPPFFDPKNANVHPIIDQALMVIGGHMAGDLVRNGRKGVVHSAIYDNWWAGGFRTTPYRHNMVGILTEAASVNGASPIFLPKGKLTGGRRGMPQYQLRTNFPDPWPGGWWRLRDIVDYELDIAMSLFTLASRYHDMFQSNYIYLGREAMLRGDGEPPFAWLVPPDQRDPGSAYELLERLAATGIEVHQAGESFAADGVTYPQGTFILYCAQPYRPHLMDMMERQVYPNRTLYPGGPAERPYDMAGWTLPLQMGVRHVRVSQRFESRAPKLATIPFPQGAVSQGTDDYYLVRPGRNDDFRLANRLFAEKIPFRIYTGEVAWSEHGADVAAGAFLIEGGRDVRDTLTRLLDGLATNIEGVSKPPKDIEVALHDAVQPRTALYQPWTASMDEGWTRLVLDNFDIPYTTIHNAGIRAGNLHDRYDCIVLPSLSVDSILDGRPTDTTAPKYAGGIGIDGVVSLQDFVQAGGTLVCIDGSSNLPIKRFNIPVHNIVAGLPSEDFYCPGSVLRFHMDTSHPLGYGMPEWYSGYFARSQAFGLGVDTSDAVAVEDNEEEGRSPTDRFPLTVVSRYSDTVLLESGWIRGSAIISDKPAIVEIEYGKGRIDLIGFGVQRRGQPHGTFRILFNAIQRSTLNI